MFKLFRFPSTILRLYELKQCSNTRLINQFVLNPAYQLNISNRNQWGCKFYSTNEEKESTNKTDEIIKEIMGANPDVEKKLKVLLLELEVLRQDGHNIPSNSFMRKQYWEELLRLGTRTGRKKYLMFLFKLEKKKENIQAKKEERRLERENQPKPVNEDGHLVYNLTHNNILLRIYDTTMNHFYNHRLIQAAMFGQPLVIDCGFDKEMTQRENVNCAKQLMFLFSENRNHDDPYDLHFCNLNEDNLLEKPLHKQITTMYEPSFPLNIHRKSYIDVFPKDKLIYLTPDCREEMLEYDHDAVYIIGAMVDKTKNDPVSLAKAKREGLKMLKLPLDRYLQWAAGSGKSLTINQMILILLDLKKTGDWNYALRHVPRRKIMREDVEASFPNINKSRTLRYDKDDYVSRKIAAKSRNYKQGFDRDATRSNRGMKFDLKSVMSK
ncbi:trna (guanine-9-) methyltransferase [Holotrichia oblita]|uniref:Trna (Guanine-9-) methyltransferase n=2 Tax=Holotrichia oblita TaxID=644536 RepID=A0ACB9T173_HOLOL|nr:trna (guanine-9-) methyltransferase [Holotrichia oblita]